MAAVLVVGVIAAAAAAYAAYQASEAQAQQYEYQKKVAKNQATVAANAAKIARENAEAQHKRILATQRARIGAAGLISSEGSPLIAQMESVEQAALDEARLTYAGQIQAQSFLSEANLLGFQARTTREVGRVSAGATLLGGTASAVSAYQGSQGSRQTSTTGTSNYGYENYETRRSQRGYSRY